MLKVFREQSRAETLWYSVVHRDTLLQGLEFENVNNRAEELSLNDWSVVTDLNDCGLNVVAWSRDRLATIEDLASLLLNLFEAVNVGLNALLGVKRSDKGVRGHGVANSDAFVCLDHAGDKVIINRLVEDDAAQGGTTLAAGSHRCKNTALEHNLQISVWHNNARVIATKFQNCSTKPLVHIARDLSADLSRASEGHERDARVVNDRGTDVDTITATDGHHRLEAILREHINDHLPQTDCRQGGGLSSLPDHGVTADKSQSDVPS